MSSSVDRPEIHVVCTLGPIHERRPRAIASFAPATFIPDSYLTHQYRWGPGAARPSRKKTRIVDGAYDAGTATAPDNLMGDEVFNFAQHRDREGEFVLGGRRRYRMECPLCGFRVVAVGDKLDDVLDDLRHADELTVELRKIGAMLNKQS